MKTVFETFPPFFSPGPLCSMLVERFGCRATVMVGGLLSGLGMVFSSLARTFTDIYITSGITGEKLHKPITFTLT